MAKKLAPTSGDVLADLGTDAAKWSAALGQMLTTKLAEAIANGDGPSLDAMLDGAPGSDLFGWVANMIEAGRSAGYAKGQEDLSSAVEFYSSFSGQFTEVAAPGKNDPTPSADNLVEWLNKSVDHPVRMTPDAVSYYVDALRREGRASILKEGLNTEAELPVLTLPDVNVIELAVITNPGGDAVLTVDGRVRAKLGLPNNVIVSVDNDRYVLLREGEALETPPNRVDGE